MPQKKQQMKQQKKQQTKYELTITKLPADFSNKFIHWDEIWYGTYEGEYTNFNDVTHIVKSVPEECEIIIYKINEEGTTQICVER